MKRQIHWAQKSARLITRDGRHAEFIALLDGGQPAPLLINVFPVSFYALEELRSHPTRVLPQSKMENYFLNGRLEQVHESPLDIMVAGI